MTTIERLRVLLAEATPGPWRLDERIGIVAVYAGPLRNCLAGEEFVHSANGTWVGDPGHWEMDPQRVATATLIIEAVNALPALLDVAEAARPFVRCACKHHPPAYLILRAALDQLDGAL